MVFARVSALAGIIGSLIVVVGSFGAWATLGGTSVGGTDGGRDGWITLVLALLTLGIFGGVLTPPAVARIVRWIPLPFALLTLLVAVIDIADISSTSSEFSNQLSDDVFTLSVGWGLWLVLAGSIVASIAAVLLMFASFPRPPHQAHPVPSAYVPGSVAPPGWLPQHPYQGQPYPPQPYPPQPYPGQYPAQPYPPQPYPVQHPPQPYPGQYPPQGPPPPAPAPPAWPTDGPAYPGSTEPDGGSAD